MTCVSCGYSYNSLAHKVICHRRLSTENNNGQTLKCPIHGDIMILQVYDNPIMLTDVYNLSHFYLKQNQDFEISHIYNRGMGMVLYGFNETVNHLLSIKITKEMVNQAEIYAEKMGMLPFPRDMWMRVVNECDGYVPLKVQALPEGTWVPKGTPFAQIRNTKKGFGELVTWWESVLMQNFFSSGCATRAAYMRKYLLDNNMNIWRFHNFGARSHSCRESMMWADSAWNLFLTGSDGFASKLYTPTAPIVSIAATAHKTIQQFDDEWEAYAWSIRSAHANGHKMVAIVIDTYNADRFIQNYMSRCVELASGLGMNLVFRPDSGQVLDQTIKIHNYAHNFGWKNVNVIIGEGMTFEKIKQYDYELKRYGVPLNFVNYGIGSGFHDDINRDYLGWAMKTAYSNGKDRMKFSMDRIKESIAGEVSIIQAKNEAGKLIESLMVITPTPHNDLYETVYEYSDKGVYFNHTPWDLIYKRCQTLVPNEGVMTVISQDIQDKMSKIRESHGL